MRPALPLLALAAGCLPPLSQSIPAPPAIASTVPADGAKGVPATVAPEVCFDQPLDPSTVSSATFVLLRAQGKTHPHVPLSVTVDASGDCALLTPAGPLAPTSGYEVEVTDAAHAQSGLAVAHATGQRIVFTASFTTAGPPTRAALLVPSDGALSVPLDLAEIEVAFSRPVAGSRSPLALSPVGGPSSLDPSGLLASVEPPALEPGGFVGVALDPALVDADGDRPRTPDALGFTIGQCAEGSPPSVGEGEVAPRDRDALLFFLVDRPSLCAATVDEEGCPDAGAVTVPAVCPSAYDPCTGGLLCDCQVPLVGLCPGGSAEAIPLATGWNGETGSADLPAPFTLSPPLPPLVLSELMLAPTGSRSQAEYVEVANAGALPVDLLGVSLASCAGSPGCTAPGKAQPFGPLSPGGSTALPPGGYALLVGEGFDPTLYPDLPQDALLLAPRAGGALLSLSATKPQAVGLFPADGTATPLSTFDGSLLPRPGLSLERVDPSAPDPLPQGFSLAALPGGTPGACNSVTPAADCVSGP